jgi:hypothetical protein
MGLAAGGDDRRPAGREEALEIGLPVASKKRFSSLRVGKGASAGMVPPSPAGFCSVATTGTPRRRAASASRRTFATTASPPAMAGIRRCCRSTRSSTDRSAVSVTAILPASPEGC